MTGIEKRIEAIESTLEKMRTTLKAKHPGHKISQYTEEVPVIKCRFAESIVLKSHSSKVTSLSFNKVKTDLLASVSTDSSIIVWDLSSFTPIQKLVIPDASLTVCKFDSDSGSLLAVGTFEGAVYIYISDKESPIIAFKSHTDYISDLVFLDPQHVITSSGDKSVKIWDLTKSIQSVGEFNGHSEDIMSLGCFENNLITGSCDHTAKLWDLRTGKLIRTFDSFLGDVNSVKFISEFSFLTGSGEGMVRLWDLRALNALGFYKVNGRVESVESSSSGRVIFSAGSNYDVKVWDLLHEDRPVQTLPRYCADIGLSGGGKGYLAGAFEENVVIWQNVKYI